MEELKIDLKLRYRPLLTSHTRGILCVDHADFTVSNSEPMRVRDISHGHAQFHALACGGLRGEGIPA